MATPNIFNKVRTSILHQIFKNKHGERDQDTDSKAFSFSNKNVATKKAALPLVVRHLSAAGQLLWESHSAKQF